MKLLLLSDLNSIHTKKWVHALAVRGIEIEIFGLGKPMDDFYDDLENVKIHHAEFNNQYGKSGAKKMKYVSVYKQIRKIDKAFKPDIVHAHYATSYGLIGTFLNHKRYLISVWGDDVFSFPKESALKKLLLKRNFRRAKGLFSTSKIMAIEAKLYTDKKVHVVPFGVDLKAFKKMEVDRDESKIIVGIVKTLEDKYGINYLIDAFDKVVKEDTQQIFELLIVGKGSKEEDLKKQVVDLGLTNMVTFTGAVAHSAVPECFNRMDIVVVPSILDGESFGVAAVEASACEKPVVVSDVGGLPEVIIEGETGLICPPRDANCLADKIAYLAKDKTLRDQLGKNGRANAYKNYDWVQNVDLMMSHYERILKEC